MHKKQTPQLICLGASHKSAPLAVREALFIDSEALQGFMPVILRKHRLDELLVLSTCNRFELYALSSAASFSSDQVYAAYNDLQVAAGKDKLALANFIAQHTYLYEGVHAMEHLFGVAASIDSLVVGETQITGQFKDALYLAAQAATLGPILGRLAQEALTAAKKVRSQTRIGERKVSVSHAAIDLAKRVFRDLSEQRFLLIGAGEMGLLAAQYASSLQPKGLHVCNRTLAKAESVVDSIGFGEAHPWSDLPELLAQVDIVISSTAASQPVITLPLLKSVMSQRKGRSLFLADIALPRDIDPACVELEEVYLFDIDDLQKVVDRNLEERRQDAESARVLINKAALGFCRWLDSQTVKPALVSFRQYLDDLIQREAQRTFGRSLFKGLSTEQEKALAALLQSISGKILGDAAKAMQSNAEGRQRLATALNDMFTSSSLLEIAKAADTADTPVLETERGELKSACQAQTTEFLVGNKVL